MYGCFGLIYYGLFDMFFDVPYKLFYLGRTQRTVQMMQSYHFRLRIHPRSALLSGSEKNSDLTCIHFIKQFLLLFRSFIIMYESNFIFGYSPAYQFALYIIIHIELLGRVSSISDISSFSSSSTEFISLSLPSSNIAACEYILPSSMLY